MFTTNLSYLAEAVASFQQGKAYNITEVCQHPEISDWAIQRKNPLMKMIIPFKAVSPTFDLNQEQDMEVLPIRDSFLPRGPDGKVARGDKYKTFAEHGSMHMELFTFVPIAEFPTCYVVVLLLVNSLETKIHRAALYKPKVFTPEDGKPICFHGKVRFYDWEEGTHDMFAPAYALLGNKRDQWLRFPHSIAGVDVQRWMTYDSSTAFCNFSSRLENKVWKDFYPKKIYVNVSQHYLKRAKDNKGFMNEGEVEEDIIYVEPGTFIPPEMRKIIRYRSEIAAEKNEEEKQEEGAQQPKKPSRLTKGAPPISVLGKREAEEELKNPVVPKHQKF